MKRKSQQHLNWYFILYCIFFLLACTSKSYSKQATKTFNHGICNGYAYQDGSFNFHLKYLLKYVFEMPQFKYNNDTTYCIIRNYVMYGPMACNCFNSKDSFHIVLRESPDSGNLKIKYKLNDILYRYKYTISSTQITSEKIKALKEYKCYFDSLIQPKINKKKPFVHDDAQFSSMILKVWRNKGKQFEFYKFIGDSLIREPLKKLEKEEQKIKIKVY